MANNKGWWRLAAGAGALLATRAIVRNTRFYELRNKTVLITGGSRGLGLVVARQLAQQGARLAICARDAAELARAERDLTQRGAEVFAVTCDVTVQSEVVEMVGRVGEHYGSIDVLINNAGVIQVGPTENMALREYEEAMQTHFFAPLYTMLAVIPGMQRRQAGRIVNVSSFGGKVSAPHLVPYCASKFALVGLSKGFRSELGKDGILVTTVCPGLIRTGSPRNVVVKGQHRPEYAWFKIGDSIPLLSATAEDAANQIIGALRHGDAELVITVPAKVASVVNELFPEFTADALMLINRFLPGPAADGMDNQRKRGHQSESPRSQSGLTRLTDEAAAANNEMPGNDPEPATAPNGEGQTGAGL
ncbi:MAG: SDR family oxidoreductase [Ferruginibacter sp.]|nr:SDR family oxidoreductase [Cytophagales bacterium]